MNNEKKLCKRCGKEFEGGPESKRFCSIKCRQHYNQMKWLNKGQVTVTARTA